MSAPRRAASTTTAPLKAPTVPDLMRAPELAAIILLEHALDVVTAALLAEMPTLFDDFHRPSQEGQVVLLADTICRRATALLDILRRYRRAVRDAAVAPPPDDDMPF